MDQEVLLRLTVPLSMADETVELIKSCEGEASEPQPASSTSDPLNAPVTGGDIQAAAAVITAVFGAGTAGLVFLQNLKKLASAKKGRIEVSNPKIGTSKRIGDDTDLDRMI